MKLLRSFMYAFEGVKTCFLTQRNFRIHIFAVIAVVAAAAFLGVSRWEWATLVICMALVISLEMINTAVELLCDRLHPEIHPLIKKMKDISAGAVMIVAGASVIIAALIFIPYLF